MVVVDEGGQGGAVIIVLLVWVRRNKWTAFTRFGRKRQGNPHTYKRGRRQDAAGEAFLLWHNQTWTPKNSSWLKLTHPITSEASCSPFSTSFSYLVVFKTLLKREWISRLFKRLKNKDLDRSDILQRVLQKSVHKCCPYGGFAFS